MGFKSEQYKEEDNKRKLIVEAKNSLESYAYQVKSKDEEKVKEVVSEGRSSALTKINEKRRCSSEEDLEVYQDKEKVEGVINQL